MSLWAGFRLGLYEMVGYKRAEAITSPFHRPPIGAKNS